MLTCGVFGDSRIGLGCVDVMNLNLVGSFGAEYKVDELRPTRYTKRLQDR